MRAQIIIPSDADQRIETPLHDAAVGTGNSEFEPQPSLSVDLDQYGLIRASVKAMAGAGIAESGAMAAGVTEWLWRINDIVATLEEWENTQ